MKIGVLAYSGYVPHFRLARSEIGTGSGVNPGRGSRAVASYDENTTTLAVEAARSALSRLGRRSAIGQLYFCTSAPAYLDKTNATAIHAALGLAPSTLAADMVGSVRSGLAALDAGLAQGATGRTSMVLLSDTRSGLPGSMDEATGGDGAAALLVGPESHGAPVLAEHLSSRHMSAEFLDRWRRPDATSAQLWEERFGEQQYVPLALEALTDALLAAGVDRDGIDTLIVCGIHQRAVKAAAAQSGVPAAVVADDLTRSIGNPATAQVGLVLADVLDRAKPGQVVVTLTLADGASASVWRTCDALAEHRSSPTVANQIASGSDTLSYLTFLSWKDQLRREPPRRPEPAVAAAPPSARRTDWKFGLVAARCLRCRTRHLPPARCCWHCGAVDQMTTERLADVPATIATFSVDRLAYSPSPPLCLAAVDFDGGGRFMCELTDADANGVAVGDRVQMTFRRMTTTGGVHNYFWKARPALHDPAT
ncbi:OB-fold domain-containing protein [Mycobacterium arosiense]|uniref:Hydroxymethylglutaryl-CoA synthase n=1 Tax=Mycobacterium arosiense ATCC BAA-1401 = DSM 45069 TaxID=1265311 RepID=A0A1W9ZC34_MYCAI|nr:OB-fold domain-containing protein [Mycobacterium arosiense]ORA11650.1 hydroxymethylglutaryl-CoA synthase [Mycobacterium arosiense ATCC BAA-1401 = DSM 45069]